MGSFTHSWFSASCMVFIYCFDLNFIPENPLFSISSFGLESIILLD